LRCSASLFPCVPISKLMLQRSWCSSGLAVELAKGWQGGHGWGFRKPFDWWSCAVFNEWLGEAAGAPSREEQARKSAVREGLPGPDPASGQGTSCLVSPGPLQPCSSCKRCRRSHTAAGSGDYPALNQHSPLASRHSSGPGR